MGPTTPTSSGPATPQYHIMNPGQQPPLSPFAAGRGANGSGGGGGGGSGGGGMTPNIYPMPSTPVGDAGDMESGASAVSATSPSGGPPVTPEGNRQRLKEVGCR